MSSANENEITGDWNNLKGTEYHLVYALWLLLYRKVASVAFYLGNDLLARPVVPPLLQGPRTLVALQVQLKPEEDEWIQLKATEKAWSISAFLRKSRVGMERANKAHEARPARRFWEQGSAITNDLSLGTLLRTLFQGDLVPESL